VTQHSPIPLCDLTILIGSPIWDKIHELYLEFTYVSAICDYADPMTANSHSPMGSFICAILSVPSNRAFAIAMDSVIPMVSDRDTRAEAKRGIKQELEASPFADGIRVSARPRAPAGI